MLLGEASYHANDPSAWAEVTSALERLPLTGATPARRGRLPH